MITFTCDGESVEIKSPDWGDTYNSTDSKSIHILNNKDIVTYFRKNFTVKLALNFSAVPYASTLQLIEVLKKQSYTKKLRITFDDGPDSYLGYVTTNPINFSNTNPDIDSHVRYKGRFSFNIEFIGEYDPLLGV